MGERERGRERGRGREREGGRKREMERERERKWSDKKVVPFKTVCTYTEGEEKFAIIDSIIQLRRNENKKINRKKLFSKSLVRTCLKKHSVVEV